MKNIFVTLCTLCILLSADLPARALTVENIPFADSTTIGGKAVPLRNAALLRYLKFIKAYVAALYLPEGVKSEDVLSDVPKRLEIRFTGLPPSFICCCHWVSCCSRFLGLIRSILRYLPWRGALFLA